MRIAENITPACFNDAGHICDVKPLPPEGRRLIQNLITLSPIKKLALGDYVINYLINSETYVV